MTDQTPPIPPPTTAGRFLAKLDAIEAHLEHQEALIKHLTNRVASLEARAGLPRAIHGPCPDKESHPPHDWRGWATNDGSYMTCPGVL